MFKERIKARLVHEIPKIIPRRCYSCNNTVIGPELRQQCRTCKKTEDHYRNERRNSLWPGEIPTAWEVMSICDV